MKKCSKNLWQWGLTLAFGLMAFLFWRYRYPHALSYQEQFQMFLFDGTYLREVLSQPGGFARYVSEFLVQFYNVLLVGALVLAVLYMLLQRLVWRLTIRLSTRGEGFYYPLSFIPALALWYTMGDESVLLAYVVALIICLLAMLLWPRNKYAQLACVLVGVPVVYWLAGPLVWLLTVYVACRWLLDSSSRVKALVASVLLVLYTLACIGVSVACTNYPAATLMTGLFYYRYVQTVTVMMALTALLCVVVPLTVRYLPSIQTKTKRTALLTTQVAVLAVLTAVVVPNGFDERKYELIEYDYLVRLKDWEGVVRKAEQKNPDLPMSVSATNLALAMTGKLGDRIFDFYQHGHEGLLPTFERNFTTAQLTGEIYYHLGLVNTAQRFAFESMECLPDYRKSVRVVKRLAETNLINGQYGVAAKYINLLKKTVFYRKWAQRTEQLIGHEQLINEHPQYGWLRKVRLPDDFLFSEKETDKICGQLFLHNPQNKMAVQYLLMQPLLDRDIERFMQYLQVVQGKISYNPRAVQETVALAFAQQRQQPPQGLISPVVLQSFNSFSNAMREGGAQLEAFRHTAWYYLTKGN